MVIAAETQKKNTVAREEYRPVASRGSVQSIMCSSVPYSKKLDSTHCSLNTITYRRSLLYFLIAEMSIVNCMYQTILEAV